MEINEFVFVMEAQCVFCVVWSHVLRCKCRLKHVIERMMEGTEDKEEDVGSYWMTLRKRMVTGNWKR